MKKLSFLTAAIWALGLILIPQAGIAKMTVMSDNDLREVTGQAGIAIQNSQFDGLNLAGKPLASPTQDGFGNFNEFDKNQMLNLAQGGTSSVSPFTGADSRFIVGEGTVGIHVHMEQMEINVDSMTTELMMGDKSMGTIGIKGLNVKMSGDVYIFMRN
jgi:hypothetical protein